MKTINLTQKIKLANPVMGVLLLFGLLGCNLKTISEVYKELIGQEYQQILLRGSHKISVRYIPETLFFLSRAKFDSAETYSSENLKKLTQQNSSKYGLTFSLDLAPNNFDSTSLLSGDIIYSGISGKSYKETLDHYLFNIGENIWLEANGKRYELSNYHMVRSWGLTKGRKFMLLFSQFTPSSLKKLKSVSLVIENFVPGQGRDKLTWKLPITKYDYVN